MRSLQPPPPKFKSVFQIQKRKLNRLTPNDPYMGHTAPLTSKCCILYIYSTNTSTEYFKRALYCPFFSLQNTVRFIMLTCLVPVLFTFYIQGVLKLKKISGTKGLNIVSYWHQKTCNFVSCHVVRPCSLNAAILCPTHAPLISLHVLLFTCAKL